MDTHNLQIFIEVMRKRSFAAVAREQELDPSAVSRSIAALESELGTRLFLRTTRRLTPTEAGRIYFERIAPAVEEIEHAHAAAADLLTQPTGTLRVTASVSFGQRCIVPLLPQFSELYPELTIELRLTDNVLDLVAERIDVGVRLGHIKDANLVAKRLLRTHYFVCASPSYLKRQGRPKHPRDVADHSCLLFPFPGFKSRWLFKTAGGELIDAPVTGRILMSNAIALQECAVAGMGIALLPNWLVDTELRAGKLVNLFPKHQVTATDFDTAVWLVHPSRDYVPLKSRVFMDFLKKSGFNSPSA